MKDFFTRYHKAKKHSYIAPAIFAMVLSVGIVGTIHNGGDLRMLSASVLQGVNSSVQYDADLMVERNQGVIRVRIGKNAEKVDSVTFSLIGDPTLFLDLTSGDPRVQITNQAPGYYKIIVSLGKSNLMAGDIITTLQANIEDKGSLTGNEANFSSEGVNYDLSIKS